MVVHSEAFLRPVMDANDRNKVVIQNETVVLRKRRNGILRDRRADTCARANHTESDVGTEAIAQSVRQSQPVISTRLECRNSFNYLLCVPLHAYRLVKCQRFAQ